MIELIIMELVLIRFIHSVKPCGAYLREKCNGSILGLRLDWGDKDSPGLFYVSFFFIDWEFWNARPYVNSVHKKSRVASNAKNTQSNDEEGRPLDRDTVHSQRYHLDFSVATKLYKTLANPSEITQLSQIESSWGRLSLIESSWVRWVELSLLKSDWVCLSLIESA